MLYEISNPKVQLSKVTEVYALYQAVTNNPDPDVEMTLIDPAHVHPVEERIALLKLREGAGIYIKGVSVKVKLKAIYVEIPNETY